MCVGNHLSVLFTGLLAALGNEPETPAQRGLKPLRKSGSPGEDGHGPKPFPGSGVHQPGGSGRVGMAGRAGHLAPLQRRRLQLHRAAVCAAEGPALRLGSLAHSIPLGQADPSLAPYIIDLPSWTQFRQDTGKTLPASSVCLGASFGPDIVLCVRVTELTLSAILPLKRTGLGGGR